MEAYHAKLVTNLSDYKLSNAERSVLYKGQKFVPTSALKFCSVQRSINTFTRRMNIQYHFSSSILKPTKSKLKKPSTWNPPKPNNQTLNKFQENITQGIYNLSRHSPILNDNLEESERVALHRLKTNKTITIKAADKGGGWVIMNTRDYIEKVLHLLNDRKFYQKLDFDPTLSNANEITSFVDYLLLRGRITETTAKYMYPVYPPRTPAFYGLPKIHKVDIPLRPIVSGNDSPTENISSYMDFVLQPLVRALPSYIRDTKDFLNQLFTLPQLPENCYLVTADVVSLYTNIPHNEGIEAVIQKISSNRESLPQDTPPNATIRILLQFILTFNVFEFLGTFYQQICGTAMGTKCAPSYACIFMGYIEEQIQELSNNILFWRRFIDDIFFIFTGTEVELLSLFEQMNQLHDTIKFTFSYSKTKVNFLDTVVQLDDSGTLSTNLFTKPTDTFSLFHFSSFHPLSTKKSIVYSQALRYRLIITKDSEFRKALSHLERILRFRKYPQRIIHEQFEKVLSLTQEEVLSKSRKEDETTKKLVFSIPFSSSHQEISNILKEEWKNVENDPDLSQIWKEPPIVATKRHTNLKEDLVHSRQCNI